MEEANFSVCCQMARSSLCDVVVTCGFECGFFFSFPVVTPTVFTCYSSQFICQLAVWVGAAPPIPPVQITLLLHALVAEQRRK